MAAIGIRDMFMDRLEAEVEAGGYVLVSEDGGHVVVDRVTMARHLRVLEGDEGIITVSGTPVILLSMSNYVRPCGSVDGDEVSYQLGDYESVLSDIAAMLPMIG